MKLYIQYAQPYEGYVSGRFDASTGVWETLRLGDAPAHVDRLLGRSGVKFFLGTLGNRRCLCIRRPFSMSDQNNACIFHPDRVYYTGRIAMTIGSCAIHRCEPCQDRKVAAVSA